MGNLFTTPLIGATPQQTENLTVFSEDVAMSPTMKKARSGLKILSPLKEQQQHRVIINEPQCNPTDKSVRNNILQAVDPPLASYPGYHGHPEVESHYAPAIQKFVRTHVKRPRSGDEASFDVPVLELPGAQRCYIIRRELGAGAYAPVYLAESVDSLENCPSSGSEAELADDDSRDSQSTNGRKAIACSNSRYGFEAIKLEVGPPNAWEFYMIRIAHERISQLPELSRAADSIIRAHELHVYKGESILVEDYRGQGTLLDLVNHMRNESIKANGTGEGGLDEALAMFFTVELFRTVEALHSCGILHGDIKADNCLIRFDDKAAATSLTDLEEEITDPREIYYSPRGLCGWRNKGLSLIDFGRGIDMRAFQPSVQFIADWETGEHECNEIREMRPWTHQIDLYGLAGTVHVMLFGKYIESTPVRKSEGGSASVRTYRIRESLKRYWDREIWTDVFDLLLNPCTERWARMELDAAGPDRDLLGAENQPILPVTHSMRYVREKMEAWLLANAEKKGLGLQIRKLEAVFAEKKKRLERS
jgi:checkpoint serine/threonine-protein kinase